MSGEENVTYFGQTDFRNQKTKFGIKNIDRSRHVYVIGKTGMGKSTLLENMAAQDILNNEGMCFIDPHGSAIDTLLEYVPPQRVDDVVYFAPFDTDHPISFNVMEDVGKDSRHLVVNGLMASFKKIWQDAWSARMEYILTNTLLALLEYPNSTLLGVNRMLAEKSYREEVIKHITDTSVRSFWIDEYGKWDPRYAREAGAAIQNKIGQFVANPLIRNIIGQSRSAFDIREIMDQKKILLINLSKGRIGEQNAKLLGGMLITKIYLAAMSRAEVGVSNLNNLPNFYFFVDEFQNFATESFADILSEARKYKLNLTIAHQYVAQMQEEVKDAVVGNVGTMITFRIGAEDAELLEKQFTPTFTAEDIVNLGKFQIYLSLMIDGIGSRPFSASTLAPIPPQTQSMKQAVVVSSRRQFAQQRDTVEKNIAKWYEPVQSDSKKRNGNNKNVVKKSFNQKNKPGTNKPDASDEFESTEEEMKNSVSPKLQALLAKMDKKKAESQSKKPADEKKETQTKPKVPEKKQKIALKTENNDPQETKPKKPTPVKPASTKKTNDRGAQTDTTNSLKEALSKILEKPVAKKQVKQKKETTQQAPKKSPEQKPKPKPKPNPETLSKPNTTPDKVGKSQTQNQSASKPKEVPEDVLKGIFE